MATARFDPMIRLHLGRHVASLWRSSLGAHCGPPPTWSWAAQCARTRRTPPTAASSPLWVRRLATTVPPPPADAAPDGEPGGAGAAGGGGGTVPATGLGFALRPYQAECIEHSLGAMREGRTTRQVRTAVTG